jgi:hypothetical protein
VVFSVVVAVTVQILLPMVTPWSGRLVAAGSDRIFALVFGSSEGIRVVPTGVRRIAEHRSPRAPSLRRKRHCQPVRQIERRPARTHRVAVPALKVPGLAGVDVAVRGEWVEQIINSLRHTK